MMVSCEKIKGPVVVAQSSWSSGLERKIMLKINFIQQILEYWRGYLMSREFWSVSWWWTLLQMKISSLRIRFAIGQGAKKKLMSWVSSRIPKPYLEKGFPFCFHDGVVLCALVEKLASGACPRFDVLDPEQKLRNLKLALYLVVKHLHIKPEVTAEQILRGGKLSERQLLLLLARMKMASEKLSFHRHVTQMTSTSKANPSQFDSHRSCFARGMGLMLAVQGRRACFGVLVGSPDNLDMVVEIRGPKNTACSKRVTSARSLNRVDSVDLCDDDVRNEILRKRIPLDYRIVGNRINVNYTPLESGPHNMSIIWQGQHIPGSPYTINVDRSVDVPDQEVWCPRAERSAVAMRRSDSFPIGGPEDDKLRLPASSCDSKRRGKIIRRKILRYIVKVGGTDVVVDDPDQLRDVINGLKQIPDERAIAEETNVGGSKPSIPASNVLEQAQVSGNTVAEFDKTFPVSGKSPITNLYGSSTFSDLKSKQHEKCTSSVESDSLDLHGASIENAVGNSISSNLLDSSKKVVPVQFDDTQPVILNNATNQTFSCPRPFRKPISNCCTVQDDITIQEAKVDETFNAVKKPSTLKTSLDKSNIYCSTKRKQHVVLNEEMAVHKTIPGKSGSFKETNKSVIEHNTSEHFTSSGHNSYSNKFPENAVDSKTSPPKEGIFFAKLINQTAEIEISVAECVNNLKQCNENEENDAINNVISSDKDSARKDKESNMELSRKTFTNEFYNNNKRVENKINETEVLPYIQQIIETATKVRSEQNYNVKDDDRQMRNTSLTATAYEKPMVTSSKCEYIRNKEKNYSKKQFEEESRDFHSIKGSNKQNLNEEEVIVNSNIIRPSKIKSYQCGETESEKLYSFCCQTDFKEHEDNILNSAREKYFNSVLNEQKSYFSGNGSCFSDANETSMNGIMEENNTSKFHNELEQDDVFVVIKNASKNVKETAPEMVETVSGKNKVQENKAKLNIHFSSERTDVELKSNATLFKCEHYFPDYDEAEKNSYPLESSIESPLSKNQNNAEDDFEPNFLQKIEDLRSQIKENVTSYGIPLPDRYGEALAGKAVTPCNSPNGKDYENIDRNCHSNTDSDFEELVFEIHQNDTSKAERHSQRKRSSWSDKTSLPCIRESSVEGILNDDGNIAYLGPTGDLDSREDRDDLSGSTIHTKNSESPSTSSCNIYEARLVSVRHEVEEQNSESGYTNPSYEANISQTKISHYNSAKSSIGLLCASPYSSKSDNLMGTTGGKHFKPSYSSFESNQMEYSVVIPENKHETEQSRSLSLSYSKDAGSEIEPRNSNGGSKIQNETNICFAGDPKIPSVRKVIEIFQKEREEPFDKWPEPEANVLKKSPIKIASECSKPSKLASTEPNCTNSTIDCDDEEEKQNNSTSIKDRVRLFENEHPKRNNSLKMKRGGSKAPTASAILDKKRYWENFTH